MSLLLFFVRVCKFHFKGTVQEQVVSHITPLSGGNLAQDGVLLAFLSGKESGGQRVRAAGQTGAVCTEAGWGSRGEGSLLPLKCGSLLTGAVCTEAGWDTQGEGCPPLMQFIISYQLLPEAQGSEG